MTLPPFASAPGTTARLEELKGMVLANIERVGWHAMGVFPTERDPLGYEFTYSIGLGLRDWPELIVVNLPPQIAHAVIASAVDVMEEHGPLEPRRRYPEILVGYDVLAVEVAPALRDSHLTWAGWYHRLRKEAGVRSPRWTAMQLVWPDKAGLFPGEQDYNAAGCPQPVLG